MTFIKKNAVMRQGIGSPNQNGTVQGLSSTGLSVVTPNSVTAGNLIVVLAQTEAAVANIGSITLSDNLSTPTVYTAIDVVTTGGGVHGTLFWGVPTVSGVATITGNQGSSFARMTFGEFIGVTSTVDVHNSAAASSSLSISPTNANELVIGASGDFHSSTTFTAGSPLVAVVSGSGADSSFLEAGVSASSGAQNITFTPSGGSGSNMYIVVAFLSVASFTSIGTEGDFYTDTFNKKVYGPRTNGVYPFIVGF